MNDKGPDPPRRTAIEILIIVLTGVVAFYIVLATLYVVFAELHNPEIDTSKITTSLSSMISGVLGALLGLIAGKSGGGEK